MKIMKLETLEVRYQHNAGQEAERVFRYTVTGCLEHADNYQGPDCLDIQVKTSKASICKGLDIRAHVASDTAKRYAYVLADKSLAYIMSPEEWIKFIDLFSHPDRDSRGKNGGGVKLRLKTENRAMREWLASHSNLNLYWVDTGNEDFDLWARDYAEAETILASEGYYVGDCLIWGPF